MANLLAKKRTAQFKTEVTEGTDPASWVSADVFVLQDLTSDLGLQTQALNELAGTLDDGETIIAGSQPTITLPFAWRGSGVAGTPRIPQSALMRTSMLTEVQNATPLPSTGATPCTAGTVNTVTIVTAPDWPSVTGGAIIGTVVELAGNPTTPNLATIVNYVVTAGNATITLNRSAVGMPGIAGGVFTTATTIKRLPGTRWVAATPDPQPSGHLRTFYDGKMLRYSKCRTNLSGTFTARGFAQMTATINGELVDEVDLANPAAPTVASPPTGVECYCTFQGGAITTPVILGASSITFDLGNRATAPDNINQPQGIDGFQTVGRKIVGSVNPLLTLTATRRLLLEVQNQTKGTFVLGYGPKIGYSAFTGNRLSMLFPNAKFTGYTINADGDYMREDLPFEATSFDGGIVFYEY